MTPEERERADRLAATAIQLASDLVDALTWGETTRAKKIRDELDRVCAEVAPYLSQYRDEQAAWRAHRGR